LETTAPEGSVTWPWRLPVLFPFGADDVCAGDD
jgi:hypothetical protein